MRRFVVIGICAAASGAPAAPYGEVLASFAAPHGFSHTLAWDGTYLWSMYDDHTHPIVLYRVDPATGSVVGSFDYAEGPVHGEPGLAADGSYVYTAHGSPDHIHTWTHTGTLLDTFKWPFLNRGLAYDGTYFWCGGMPFSIYQTTLSGSVVASFPVACEVYDLAYDGEYVCYTTNGYLFALTTTGSVITTVAVPASLGCAWGGGYLWVGGAYLYKLGWESLSDAPPASFGKIKALGR